MASSLAQRARKDPRLLRRALKDPGLRSKLPSSMLRPGQRAQRQRNAAAAKAQQPATVKRSAGKQPVVPGGTLTRDQLRKTARSEANVKYGPLEAQQQRQVGEAQTWQHDVGGYYDQYLDQIAKQSQQVRSIGNEANTALQNLQGGVTGLAGADLNRQQGAANQDAAARGATAGDNTQMASNAAATRQALLGSFAASQVAQNSAATRYADMLALNVAPAQKLQAVAMAGGRVRQAREKQAETAREKGAFKLSSRQSLRADEAKNVLAREIATGKSAVDQAQLRETVRSHKAGEGIDRKRIKADKQKARTQAALTANKRATSGPFAGLTQSQINGLSDADAQRKIKAYQNKGGGSGGGDTPGGRRAEKNRVAGVRKVSGKALGRVRSASDEWNFLKTQPYTPPGKSKEGEEKKARKAHPSEIKAALRGKGYSADEIHLALMPPGTWTATEIAMAHRLGIKVPRDYLQRTLSYSKGSSGPD